MSDNNDEMMKTVIINDYIIDGLVMLIVITYNRLGGVIKNDFITF